MTGEAGKASFGRRMKAGGDRIGILGGTFNPVHLGHLEMARSARRLFELDRVIFVPVSRPPHKEPVELAPARHRLEMLRLALEGEEGFEVSDIEIRRGGESYTVETVEELLSASPGFREVFVIIGADNLQGISTWKRIADLVKMARFIVFERPGRKPGPLSETDRFWAGRIAGRPVPLSVPVSSTAVRAAAAAGRGLSGMVAAGVEEYIRRNGLYRG